MSNLKLNNPNKYESFEFTLRKDKHPIAYYRKMSELLNQGLSLKDAENIISNPIELEIYYEIDNGLMCVEAEAVESGTIFSPYTQEQYEDDDTKDDTDFVKNKTDSVIDELFVNCHKKFNTKSGDITLNETLEISRLKQKLVSLIKKQINENN